MSRLTRKFIAVLMLVWLPIATGSALAASISMQMPKADCHKAAMQAMSHDGMAGHHHMHHHEMPPAEKHGPSCDTCGVCHLACTGYVAVPGTTTVAVQTAARETTPYVVFFQSVTSVPLLPPPLVRA